MGLTELEKTILLGFLILSKGKFNVYFKEENILKHFPMRQRKNASISLKRLIKLNYIIMDKKTKKLCLSETGIKEAKELLKQGAKIWLR